MEPKEGPPSTSPDGSGGAAPAGGGGGGGGRDRGGPLRLRAGSATASGSATTVVVAEPRVQEPPVLRLVLEPRPHVRWDEGVVDNEHMNKKSSKRCCIFHKKRAFGESSSESESEDEGDSSGGDGQGGGGDKGKQGDSHMRIAQPKHPPVRPWETYHA